MPARPRTALAAAFVAVLVLGPAAPALAAPGTGTRDAGAASTQAYPAPDAAALRAAIAGLPDEEATAALVRVGGAGGDWRGSSGVAALGSQRPALEHGRFRVGSTTKVFTAAVVLQLAAERRIDLDRPVQTYLPHLLPRTFEPVTVRQLLNHTSGIQPADGPGDTFEDAYAHRFDTVTPRETVASAVAKGPEFAPGAEQHYLNINYTVLGLLIEERTGHTYADEVARRVLRPLGLRHTSVPGTDPRIHGPHNRGYQSVATDGGGTELRDVTEWNSSSSWAAGDIISTTADLERFLTALFRGRVVPEPQLREMFTVPEGVRTHGSGEPAAYSAGLTRLELSDGSVVWGKSGGRYGYNTVIAATRELSRTLVASVNGTDAKGQNMNRVIGDLTFAAFGR
ncbi:serine hydrolase domain-containing protein [Streptomyces sp. NPDC054796]